LCSLDLKLLLLYYTQSQLNGFSITRRYRLPPRDRLV
jgi:hypothetical protein